MDSSDLSCLIEGVRDLAEGFIFTHFATAIIAARYRWGRKRQGFECLSCIRISWAQERPKQGNLSFSHIIACSPANHQLQFSGTILGEGLVLPHALIHPFKIHCNFPKYQHSTEL